MGPKDLPAVLELEQRLFDNALSETMLERELEAGYGFVFADPEVRGYALVRPDQDLLDLTRLGVQPETQGQGIGTRLLQRVLQDGPSVLLTVRKTNLDALRLYQRHGFGIVAQLSEGPAQHAWVLRRPPSPSEHPSTCSRTPPHTPRTA